MSFIGKILVVMQLVLSICLMAFAAAVSTYQTNWKAESEKIKKLLDSKTADHDKLAQDKKAVEDKFTLDLNNEKQRADTADSKVANLNKEKDTLAGENKRLNEEAALKAQINTDLVEDSNARQAEVKLVREKYKLALEDRDKEYKQKADLEDKIFEQNTKIERLMAQNKTLLATNQQFKDVLISKGFPTEIEEYQKSKAPPPKVFGEVLEARKSKDGGDMLLSISLGENDGLSKGHVLFVYRKGDSPKFLGKARVLDIQADTAVLTLFQNSGLVEKGDHVATKLN